MSNTPSLPGSPGGPLQAVTAERVNQQRESIFSHGRSESRDSSVHDKISQFNNLSVSLQSKQLERKTADAALKRAMLGREEAETEMRRYREEVKALQRAVEEGKDRERRVGERLETLMENYGRAKETHAHTQALWEKEIRRARKETFKTQSSIVKLQEELKSSRGAAKMNDENLKREKERSKVREQEAFTARYQIVGVQEQLDQALERIKVVEQERDAYKTAAQNEEVARIAAEGRIPLPPSKDADDEFASPKKKKQPRVSLSTMDIVSSAASEAEIEDLSTQLVFERQRADRAQDMVEFLQLECQLGCCPCVKSKSPSRRKRRSSIGLEGPNDKLQRLDDAGCEERAPTPPQIEEPEPQQEDEREVEPQLQEVAPERLAPRSRKEPRRSTIFCPKEGIFRTVSEQEAEALEAQKQAEAKEQVNVEQETCQGLHSEAEVDTTPEPVDQENVEAKPASPYERERYARTPSVEPPSFALLAQERLSLASLLNAPHSDSNDEVLAASLASIPTMPDAAPNADTPAEAAPDSRPHTSASFYTVTTTTSVPLHDGASRPDSSFYERLRTPTHGNASFDLSNPALTPTMTREQALAKIRERRGRARSIAQGTMTPRRKMVEGVDRRQMSAPTTTITAAKKR
ncbi:hypothetical protein EDB81DRAFT_929128 [Dactylonectria macrodidyma]|uniref:Uncharacterized protein n=1 Tax=Dactylonectria macrodidyma TaxID=307937 RepID=A0A9P9FA16_9HYPO|nr:hypothetical protein EDB81DRAFT_929128 [Dactylonectria macrodidyma]